MSAFARALRALGVVCLAFVGAGSALAEEPVRVEMVSALAGSFEMGSASGNAAAIGDEWPRHSVALSAYLIGEYEVTNRQYAAVLNWALRRGRLGAYTGGDVHAYGKPVLHLLNTQCDIVFEEGAFAPRVRDGYSMAQHPVVLVSWYGAVVFCNWLSEMQGLPPCYDAATWTRTTPQAGGYRLPTEAEWERAAAWDPAANPPHRTYAFASETIDFSWCTYREARTSAYANPMGLQSDPRSSPIGFHAREHGGATCSPVGCWDMSGNVWEWCHDWYDAGYYAHSPAQDPAGPEHGEARVERGGSWNSCAAYCRTAKRNRDRPSFMFHDLGFRVARSLPGPPAAPTR